MIIETIFSIISYYTAFYLEYVNICLIVNKKHEFKIKNFIIIGLISAANYGLTLLGIVTIKMVFSFMSILLIALFVVKINYRESLISSTIYYIMILIIEYFSAVIIVDVLKYDPNRFLISVGIQKCIIGHIINIITLLVCAIKIINKLYTLILNLFEKLNVRNIHILYFVFSIFIFQMMYIYNIAGKINIVYGLLYIIVYITFIFFTVISLHKNYYLKMLNSFLLDNDKNMQKILDEYRMFQHNIKNDLLAISSISSKKVKNMILEYMESYHLNYDGINNIASMPEGLKGVIYQKIISFDNISSNIIVDNYIENDPMNILNIKDYRKLVESIGIIVDNALEAMSHNSEDYVYIYLNEDKNNYIIKCINTFNNTINVDDLMNIGCTTKKKHSGMGLYYIKNKTCFDYKTTIVNNKFCSELIVKK